MGTVFVSVDKYSTIEEGTNTPGNLRSARSDSGRAFRCDFAGFPGAGWLHPACGCVKPLTRLRSFSRRGCRCCHPHAPCCLISPAHHARHFAFLHKLEKLLVTSNRRCLPVGFRDEPSSCRIGISGVPTRPVDVVIFMLTVRRADNLAAGTS